MSGVIAVNLTIEYTTACGILSGVNDLFLIMYWIFTFCWVYVSCKIVLEEDGEREIYEALNVI